MGFGRGEVPLIMVQGVIQIHEVKAFCGMHFKVDWS